MSNTNWTEKLKIEVIDEEDGSCTIHIEWDDTDPDLALWTSWGEEGQKAFVMSALHAACAEVLGEEIPDWYQDLTELVD
jgi:hypothetical protein